MSSPNGEPFRRQALTVLANSKLTTLHYSDEPAWENYPCIVKITDKEILIEYHDEDRGTVQYRGLNDGSGHFELSSKVTSGRATLHMFPKSTVLEGSWIEDGARGMWLIHLS
jgi:hypothetical protein